MHICTTSVNHRILNMLNFKYIMVIFFYRYPQIYKQYGLTITSNTIIFRIH